MGNFWDYSSWSGIFLVGILLGSLLIGNILKKAIPFLRESLVPTSVLAGIVILIFTSVYKAITGEVFFDTGLFNGKGTAILELITYHALALGFIASSLKTTGGKLTKQRSNEIFNTGVTTVSTYLIQAIVGMTITIIAYFVALAVINFL